MRFTITRIIVFLFVYIFINQSGFSQNPKTKLINFIETELKIGDYTFQIMTNKIIPRKSERTLLVDGNGKILNSEYNRELLEEEPTMQFKSTGSIKLKIEYKDSIYTMHPIKNSFYPLVNINLKTSTVTINEYILKNVKAISIKNKDNSFKSKWNGYLWWSNLTNESLKISPKLKIGRINENHKIYIEILWYQDGTKKHYRLVGQKDL